MNIRQALKTYKSAGRTTVKLNSTSEVLLAEFTRLTLEDLTEVTQAHLDNMEQNTSILVVNPERISWGVQNVRRSGDQWIYKHSSLFSGHMRSDGTTYFKLVPSTLPNGCCWTELSYAVNNH